MKDKIKNYFLISFGIEVDIFYCFKSKSYLVVAPTGALQDNFISFSRKYLKNKSLILNSFILGSETLKEILTIMSIDCLEKIHLNKCKLSDITLKILPSNFPNLLELSFDNNMLTKEIFEFLFNMNAPNLGYLSFCGNFILYKDSHQDVEILRKKFPKLTTLKIWQ